MVMMAAHTYAQPLPPPPPPRPALPKDAKPAQNTVPETSALPEIALPEATSAPVSSPVAGEVSGAPVAVQSETSSLPPVGAGAAANTDSRAASDKPSKKRSYKDFGVSLFYRPAMMQRLDSALSIADVIANQPKDLSPVDEVIAAPTAPKIELTEYPVFYLSSIVFSARNRWTLWLNGNRVTPKELPQDIEVVGISPDSVRLRWKPMAFGAIKMNWQPDAKENSAIKYKLTATQPVAVNTEESFVEFSLRPNQSYNSAYNAILEGKSTPLKVDGAIDMNKINDSLFENTLRNSGAKAVRPSESNAKENAPKVVRPNTAPPVKRASGLTPSDSKTLGQVPSIFPGGVPSGATAKQEPGQPMPSPPADAASGLPILPPGVNP